MARRNRKTIISKDGILHSERRVVRIGNAVGITLPIRWLEEHDIKPGDTISLMANSILSMSKKREHQPA